MKTSLFRTLSFCVVSICCQSAAIAATIDFESLPSGVPTDGLVISDQFLASDGVTFQLENGSFPVLAKVGGPLTAFFGPPNNTGYDTVASGQNVGEFFLTDDGTLSGAPASPLIITYHTPTTAASGVILDLDFEETWTIEAYDALGAVLATIILSDGDPNTGDGIATPWSFQFQNNDIYSIKMSGYKPGAAFGLAFDNFNARSASTVPIPMAAWLFASGLLSLIGFTKRKAS